MLLKNGNKFQHQRNSNNVARKSLPGSELVDFRCIWSANLTIPKVGLQWREDTDNSATPASLSIRSCVE